MDSGAAAQLLGAMAVVLQGIALELALFAAIGVLLFGVDDLAVDVAWLGGKGRSALRRFDGRQSAAEAGTSAGPAAAADAPVALCIPAWQEAHILESTVARMMALWGGQAPAFRLYIGCYPNDPLTLMAASRLAAVHPAVRLAIHTRHGPTTKADCLNMIWQEVQRDEAAGMPAFAALVVHDAEDIVHRDGLALLVSQLPQHHLVQLPVLPRLGRGERLWAGHYADEFAEAHEKELPLRQALGAVVPSAGVGFALRRDSADRLTAGGAPLFAPDSLTEDYELAHRVASAGGRIAFAQWADAAGHLIATQCHYPNSLWPIVEQKARWICGIAIAGWDRLGWPRHGDAAWVNRWMLWRDRRALVGALIITAAYAALLLLAGAGLLRLLAGGGATSGGGLDAGGAMLPPALDGVLLANAALLMWRLVMRVLLVARRYGWQEAPLAIPRAVLANMVLVLAARRAAMSYLRHLRGQALRWDKTDHADVLARQQRWQAHHAGRALIGGAARP